MLLCWLGWFAGVDGSVDEGEGGYVHTYTNTHIPHPAEREPQNRRTMVLLGRSSKNRRRFSARVRGAGRWLHGWMVWWWMVRGLWVLG